jgi:hypothetical protein
MPKLFRNRPTIPFMNATGRNTAISESVVAHRLHARPDRRGVVAHHLNLRARRQRALHVRQLGANGIDHRDRVLARLLADRQHHRGRSVDRRSRRLLFGAVLDAGHVLDADRMVPVLADHDAADAFDTEDATLDAQRHVARPGLDGAAGQAQVLGAEGALDVDGRQPLRLQLRRVEPQVHLALLSADDRGLPHTVDALDLSPDSLVGQLGQIAPAPGTAHGNEQDRGGVGIELGDDGRIDALGQLREDGRDVVAHLLHGDVDVLVEAEGHDDERHALARGGSQLVDAANRVDGALDLIGEAGLDLLGRRAVECRGDENDGDVDVGEEVDPERAVAHEPEDHDREHQHPREDRVSDAEGGEPLHSRSLGWAADTAAIETLRRCRAACNDSLPCRGRAARSSDG